MDRYNVEGLKGTFSISNIFKEETVELLKKAMGEKRFNEVFDNEEWGEKLPNDAKKDLGYEVKRKLYFLYSPSKD